MTLEWTLNDNQHNAYFSDSSEASMASVIDQTMEKTVSLLRSNAKDESRFLLMLWSSTEKSLSIFITDENKTDDAAESIKLTFAGDIDDIENFLADLKYYCKDYLTTSSEYMNYSLIAAFCIDSREKAQLL